jgi:putative nucleotidyltransferase with HDIG domain
VSSTNLSHILEEVILARVKDDTLVIPTMPEVAARCLTLLREEDVDLRVVAKLIEREPVIAARLLRLASSAALGGEKSPSIQQACARLGAAALRKLIMDATARQLFQSRDPRIAATVRELWDHSLAVALLARDLAAILGTVDPEGAYLAGLVHDVGKPIAAAILLELERSTQASRFTLTADSWLLAVQGVHRTVGVAVVDKWKLPEAIAQAIRDSSEFDNADRDSLANVVCFANSVAKWLCGVSTSDAVGNWPLGRTTETKFTAQYSATNGTSDA